MSSIKLRFHYPENYIAEDKEIFYFLDKPEMLPLSNVTEFSGWWDTARSRILSFPEKLVSILSLIVFRKKLIRLKSATWITNHYSMNYFHWINDALPRLMLLRDNNIHCPILLPENIASQQFVKDTLKSLGWDHVAVSLNNICKVDKLFLPDMTAGEGSQHPVYFKNVCKALTGEALISPSRKIFISRADSPFRNILPTQQFEQLIKDKGFEIVKTDKMTIAEQITLFKDCSHLVAVHGAGLTNMAFMKERQGKVLEIRRSDDKLNYCYFKMANVLNHQYYYFLAEAEDVTKTIQSDNVVVDLISFEKTLNNFMQATGVNTKLTF